MATKGYAAPEVEKAYTRARELCQQVGETPQLFPVLCGLWIFYMTGGVTDSAYELAEQSYAWPRASKIPSLLLEAHMHWGRHCIFLGELTSAREHLEQGIALYDPQTAPLSCRLVWIRTLGWIASPMRPWTLWYLGYPDQALKRSHEALTLAQETVSPL